MRKFQHHFVLRAHNLRDRVIPPLQDPFSSDELVRTGESALNREVRRWRATGCWDFTSTNILLPKSILASENMELVSQR